MSDGPRTPSIVSLGCLGLLLLLVAIGLWMSGCPKYPVWQQKLKRAEQEKQILIEQVNIPIVGEKKS